MITQRVGGTEAGGDSWGNQRCREARNTRGALSKEGIVGKVLCMLYYHIGYVTETVSLSAEGCYACH